MKLFNIERADDFFDVVNSCENKVELVTPQGDRYNLKSKLSQFVALAKVFPMEDKISEVEIVAENPKDTARLLQFAMCH